MPAPTVDHLRQYAIARTLFKPTTLGCAIVNHGFLPRQHHALMHPRTARAV